MEQVLRHSWCCSPTNSLKILVTAGASSASLIHQNPSVQVSSVSLLTMTSNQPINSPTIVSRSTFQNGNVRPDWLWWRASTKALRLIKPSTKLLSFISCGSRLLGFVNFGMLDSMRKTEDAWRPIIKFSSSDHVLRRTTYPRTFKHQNFGWLQEANNRMSVG